MKVQSIALVIAAAAAVVCISGAARADSVGYSMSSPIPTNSSTQGIDLTDGGNALDWMAFVGVSPAPSSNNTYNGGTMAVWDGSPSGGTESITPPTAASTWDQGTAGPFVQFSNGTDPFGDTGLSYVTSDYAWNWYTPGTTFTQTLIQSTESLSMPVISYTGGNGSTGLQILATLADSAGTATASLPATVIPGSAMNAIDGTHYDGILTINVAGAIGDTLSVSVGEPDGNSGIFGVTVTPGGPVPEPSTCALLIGAAIGGLALVGRRRTRPTGWSQKQPCCISRTALAGSQPCNWAGGA